MININFEQANFGNLKYIDLKMPDKKEVKNLLEELRAFRAIYKKISLTTGYGYS